MSEPLDEARQRLEAKIEELIALLDLLDGDENLEPYLADTFPNAADLEADDCDLEPSCGWTIHGMHGYGNMEEEPNGDELDTDFNEDEGGYGDGFDGSGIEMATALLRRAAVTLDVTPKPKLTSGRKLSH